MSKRTPVEYTVELQDSTGRPLTADELAAWGKSPRVAATFGRLIAAATIKDTAEPEPVQQAS